MSTTLGCECGGAVEIVRQSYERDADGKITGEGSAFELYECVSCGRRGTYTFDEAGAMKTGCLR